ncbi:MAG TPA: hypothetical protein VGD98_05715 [Ktedonobacteraceae bacterium]
MTRVAMTGSASRFAQVLLPLLQQDAEIDAIVGIDVTPPAGTAGKLHFHQRDVRAPELQELLAGEHHAGASGLCRDPALRVAAG